jgi:hypothetical protein
MGLKNFRDMSRPNSDVSAGFQYEFYCENCQETWRSPFKPYRAGQAAGLFTRFSWILNEFYKIGGITDLVYKAGRASGQSASVAGSKVGAKAFAEAEALAVNLYHKCGTCRLMVCEDCWREEAQMCVKCEANAAAARQVEESSQSSATVCPNCRTPSQGGRFCHECGFDMASTHKSCPACGSTMARQARFCTDCGHGF